MSRFARLSAWFWNVCMLGLLDTYLPFLRLRGVSNRAVCVFALRLVYGVLV